MFRIIRTPQLSTILSIQARFRCDHRQRVISGCEATNPRQRSWKKTLTLVVEGRTGVTWFLGGLEGTFVGTPFAVRLRYTRTWIHDDDHGWRVVAAHASFV